MSDIVLKTYSILNPMQQITAQQLRIGNILECKIQDELDERKEWHEPYTIDAEDILACSIDEKGFNEWQRPIPLTEEILIKCGFDHIQSMLFIKDYIRIYLDDDGEFTVNNINGETVEYRHLHTLQNIFWLLTGKDLIYKH